MSELITRIGILVPSSDAVSEMDFHNYLPPGISFHTARLPHDDNTKRGFDTLDEICDGLEAGARRLVQVDPAVIVFSCTSGSFHRGEGWDLEVKRRIETAAGVPAIVTAMAVTDALQALGARRVFMVTPYPEEINRIEVEYLGRNGIEVVDYVFFHREKSKEISYILPSEIRARILEERAKIEPCDAVFISCTGLRGMEVAADVEAAVDRPVVTSNSANVWATLRFLGMDGSAVPAGRVFRLLGEPAASQPAVTRQESLG